MEVPLFVGERIWKSRCVVHIPRERKTKRNPAPLMPLRLTHGPGALQTAFHGDWVCTLHFRSWALFACRSQGLLHAVTLFLCMCEAALLIGIKLHSFRDARGSFASSVFVISERHRREQLFRHAWRSGLDLSPCRMSCRRFLTPLCFLNCVLRFLVWCCFLPFFFSLGSFSILPTHSRTCTWHVMRTPSEHEIGERSHCP